MFSCSLLFVSIFFSSFFFFPIFSLSLSLRRTTRRGKAWCPFHSLCVVPPYLPVSTSGSPSHKEPHHHPPRSIVSAPLQTGFGCGARPFPLFFLYAFTSFTIFSPLPRTSAHLVLVRLTVSSFSFHSLGPTLFIVLRNTHTPPFPLFSHHPFLCAGRARMRVYHARLRVHLTHVRIRATLLLTLYYYVYPCASSHFHYLRAVLQQNYPPTHTHTAPPPTSFHTPPPESSHYQYFKSECARRPTKKICTLLLPPLSPNLFTICHTQLLCCGVGGGGVRWGWGECCCEGERST